MLTSPSINILFNKTHNVPFIQLDSIHFFRLSYFSSILHRRSSTGMSTMNQTWNMWKLLNNSLPLGWFATAPAPRWPQTTKINKFSRRVFRTFFTEFSHRPRRRTASEKRAVSIMIKFPTLNKYDWHDSRLVRLGKIFERFCWIMELVESWRMGTC